jgi:hypothetical protein
MLTASELDLSGSTVTYPLRLTGAEIIGQLICRGAQLTGADSNGDALVAEGMRAGSMLLTGGFTAAGAIRLLGAEIKSQLACSGAQLTGTDSDGLTLVADGMKVGRDVFLTGGFTAAGVVRLRGTDITGQLGCRGAKLTGTDSDGNTLEGATVGQLEDNWGRNRPNGHWPADGRLHLDGFTYGRFGGVRQATVEQRLAWIRSQYQPRAGHSPAHFATQPYEQLADVYRQSGQDDQARKVAIARRADLRKYGNLNAYRWFGNWFLDWTIKYGYQTWRAGVGLAAVFVIFLVLSILGQRQHVIVPIGEGLHSVPTATQCTSEYPCFYPAGYTVDTVIPIINVHQADYWGPDGHAP